MATLEGRYAQLLADAVQLRDEVRAARGEMETGPRKGKLRRMAMGLDYAVTNLRSNA